MKRKAVERKPGMRHRSQSQLDAERAAAIVRQIELRIRQGLLPVAKKEGQ